MKSIKKKWKNLEKKLKASVPRKVYLDDDIVPDIKKKKR